MTYVKTFAIFESETPNFEINEAAKASIKPTPEFKTAITAEFKKLTPEKKEQLKGEMVELAKKLNLKGEELTNPDAVAKALISAGMVKESMLSEDLDELNEGIKEWWGKHKNTVFKWMTKIGVGGMLAGLATICYGSSLMPNVDYMAYDQVVSPNNWIIAGGAAMGISFVATLLGMVNLFLKRFD